MGVRTTTRLVQSLPRTLGRDGWSQSRLLRTFEEDLFNRKIALQGSRAEVVFGCRWHDDRVHGGRNEGAHYLNNASSETLGATSSSVA